MKRYIIPMIFITNSLFGQTLTLQDAIDKALKTHPDIKTFILNIDKSRLNQKISKSDYLPQLNFEAEYDPTRTYAISANNSFTTKDNDNIMLGLTLHQKIWDFDKTSAKIASRKIATKVAELSLKDAKALMAYKVKVQYALLKVAKDAILVRKKDLEVKDELYKQSLALVKQGLKTTVDSSRFLSSLYMAKDSLAIAQADFDKTKYRLSLYIGEKVDADVKLDSNIKRTILDKEEVLSNAPSLKAMKSNIQKLNLDYKSSKASQYGSIDALASYTYQDNLNSYDSSMIGITLNIPLFSGGKISSQIQNAQIDKQNAQMQYDSKKLALKEEIGSLLIDIKRYKETIKSKEAQLDSATQTSDVLEARYKEGLTTYIEILDAISLKLNAKFGLINAKYERDSAIYKLEYLKGKI